MLKCELVCPRRRQWQSELPLLVRAYRYSVRIRVIVSRGHGRIRQGLPAPRLSNAARDFPGCVYQPDDELLLLRDQHNGRRVPYVPIRRCSNSIAPLVNRELEAA